jgi:hypothetical protein
VGITAALVNEIVRLPFEKAMTRARVVRIILVLAVVSLPAIYIFFLTGHTGTALDRTLWDIGFYPVKPPSNLVGPGSIYHVSRDGKFYTTICKADEEDIKSVMERSPSEEMIARELQNTNYGLGADPVRFINAKLNSDVVESVNYTLTSVNVLEIPLEKNYEIFVKLTQRDACRQAIDSLLQAREFVCQGQSGLVATVEYKLTSKAVVEGGAKITPEDGPTIKAALEAAVNADIKFDRGRFVSGTGLHYGVKVNPTCVARPTDGARHLPRNTFDRIVNFVLLDLLHW